MNRTPRLSKSGIEYLDYVWNFYSGCLHKLTAGICPVPKCWAEEITIRFQANYPNDFRPTYYPEAFLSPLHLKRPARIGCAFMGDLFGDWVDPDKKFCSTMPSGKVMTTMSLKGWIFTTIKQCPQHTFIFLTKRPQNLALWEPFPDNCWVGVTATDGDAFQVAQYWLELIKAKVKFISFEPLLDWHFHNVEHLAVSFRDTPINWVIIGAQTNPYKPPQVEWVTEVVWACVKAGIPVFLKNNLIPCLRAEKPFLEITKTHRIYPRQELPNVNAV